MFVVPVEPPPPPPLLLPLLPQPARKSAPSSKPSASFFIQPPFAGPYAEAERSVSGNDDLDHPVLHLDGKGLDGRNRRQRERPPSADLDPGAVPGTDRVPLLDVEVALAERAVVVRTAILDRAEAPGEVVDADRDLARVDDLDRAGRELLDRSDVDLGHAPGYFSSSSSRPAHSSGSGVPLARWSATLSTPRPSSAHLRRIGVSGMPISSSSVSLGSTAISPAFRPLTISISIEVDAWLIAQPRPENFTSSIVSPSSSH